MVSKIRIGLVGASVSGTWSSRAHMPALKASKEFELRAVCTTKPESAEAARQTFGAKLAFHDFNKMVTSTEIDAVAVVVRVPSHFAPAKTAIEAGKHVYCEWPLGQTTDEAETLTALAKKKEVVTAVGLQARACPEIQYMKGLVEDGYLGEVLSVHCHVVRDGVLTRPSHRTWQRDITLGANSLTILNGHTIDALQYVAGAITKISAIVDTRVSNWLDTGNNRTVKVTSPDHIFIQGELLNGAPMTSHTAVIPFAGSGYRMAIYGDKGTLVIKGDDSVQLTKLSLFGAQGNNTLNEMAIPNSLKLVSAETPRGEPFNVGQMYSDFARSINEEKQHVPSFSTAVGLHQLIDKIQNASSKQCAISL